MGEESHIVRHREDGTNNIVLRYSQVKDLGIELSTITIQNLGLERESILGQM